MLADALVATPPYPFYDSRNHDDALGRHGASAFGAAFFDFAFSIASIYFNHIRRAASERRYCFTSQVP
jgi:hypothetical protein